MTPWRSSARAWRAEGARQHRVHAVLLAALAAVTAAAAPAGPAVDAQRDPELGAVVQAAIEQAECFADQYESAVWYKLMEPRLRRYVPDRDERLTILRTVYCETHRDEVTPLPAGLVLAVLDVESRFNRWAVSSAGAVGLMQVMPFWPEKLGMRRHQLTAIEPNIRMGCAILRFYLERERHDLRRALARYNGSVGTRTYADLVVVRWTSAWNGADDLGRKPVKPS
ncbi:MAG: lytic transglycosylase domain-containing protein [Gammaproteobacteria bacterium]|nr:lytic transglycosylase domain-containing protein [Gammaproteobacteria bacterium]